MLPVEKLIRIAILVLVVVSGLLLGLSLSSWPLILIAVTGAIVGYLITDYWKLFRLNGILANIASVVILVLAMKDFFPADSTGKLVSVANLLVYLQSVLMFQEKTPRLIWQILVLSLLQVVVSAIFSLDLEGGLLFLFYFLIAGSTLALQSIYARNRETGLRNEASANRATRSLATSALDIDRENDKLDSLRPYVTDRNQEPFVFFDPELRDLKPLRPLMKHLAIWMAIAFCFTTVMFYMIPRHTQPWFGTARIEVASNGFFKSVDLLNHGEIKQTNQLIFRASFESVSKISNPSKIVDAPYFRGMALSNLVIEDGRTNWRAPHDRIHAGVYQDLGSYEWGNFPIRQLITLEESLDPLVYSTMPALPIRVTPGSLNFCHEISALTRCRINDRLELAPYKYELVTFLDNRGAFVKSWPYFSNSESYQQAPMSADPPEEKWLTYLEPERYPTIVRLASSITDAVRAKNPTASRLELLEEMEKYFLDAGRFHYTLDFRDVKWDERIDPIEDFVCNHRSGHCELFASALTLMLRSQGIPARLVVGFYGGDMNKLNGLLMVRGKHAHAWVEAYLRPEDCTSQMLAEGSAGPGGAWLRMDPTPPTGIENTGTVGAEAIDMARTMWQDYVLGMNSEAEESEIVRIPGPLMSMLEGIDFDKWQSTFRSWGRSSRSAWFRIGLVLLILVPLLMVGLPSLFSGRKAKQSIAIRPKSRLRRWVAGAIALIAPGLGLWMLSDRKAESSATLFYRRMLVLLRSHGLERQPSQTHREFAIQVGQRFADHPLAAMIQSTVWEVSEIFNAVRFGRQQLPGDLREQVDLCLDELQAGLAMNLELEKKMAKQI